MHFIIHSRKSYTSITEYKNWDCALLCPPFVPIFYLSVPLSLSKNYNFQSVSV